MALAFSELLVKLRGDTRVRKIPPYLSALCVLIGLAWTLLLPLNRNSRQTYISENALLPGQVHTYFGGSEQNVFRAYKQELLAVKEGSEEEISERILSILRVNGLKTATQKFEYESAGKIYGGENVYSVLHAPRGDGTEAIVLVAAWKNIDGGSNVHGVALVLTLARYFRRMDQTYIIILLTPDSSAGPQAWIDAYHDMHSSSVQPLSLKSGALQGAVAVDLPFDHRFSTLHVSYDGINGQLPNLDLFNTAVSIASGQMGIGTSLQHMYDHNDSYRKRLETMLKGMANQAIGHATGPHSVFIPYHVDAITLTAVGDGWQDEMAFGRTVEGLFRSLNNLLEHFHQSFFFYLLMQTNRFVSIGTYLPSAMLVAANFTIMAIALWVKSHSAGNGSDTVKEPNTTEKLDRNEPTETKLSSSQIPPSNPQPSPLAHALVLVLLIHLLSTIPLYLFNHLQISSLPLALNAFTLFSYALPLLIASLSPPSRPRTITLTKSLSLLLLGLFLSTLATLNFSFSLAVGLLCVPLTFIPTPGTNAQSPPTWQKLIVAPLWVITNPGVVPRLALVALGKGGFFGGVGGMDQMGKVLESMAFAWNVWGARVPGTVVWAVWWPAWVLGGVVLWSG
ncbi:MAG: hypothetical protein Q9160_001887 [Pyrenula sp. 1 TL-2023]